MALEKNPQVAKAFVDGGHEVASHACTLRTTADHKPKY
jgi:peptidoglycan/xylan/chitin deacetylase (PgdA/CDA1 family)